MNLRLLDDGSSRVRNRAGECSAIDLRRANAVGNAPWELRLISGGLRYTQVKSG
jgi:hypothetical protein